MQLTTHFADFEFTCKCCGVNLIKTDFVKDLEQLYRLLDDVVGIKAIYVNSGYRCSRHSLEVGGSTDDAHTQGFAADIKVMLRDGSYLDCWTIAEAAELFGFGGIGIISDIDVHLDRRDKYPYKNNHWYGNEKTGENYQSFIDGSKYTAALQQAVRQLQKHKIQFTCTFDDKKYSGLLEEV